jgi:hypothetical protein
MQPNFIVILLAGLVPLIVGFIWYNPKVFGDAWMKAIKVSEEDMKGANMAKIFGFTYLLSVFVSLGLLALVIHQYSIYSILANDAGMSDPNSEISLYVKDFMSKYGTNFRTFKHGAFHGFLYSVFLALPILGINGLFERRSGKYIFIHAGFWAVCFMLMGGILCQWA